MSVEQREEPHRGAPRLAAVAVLLALTVGCGAQPLATGRARPQPHSAMAIGLAAEAQAPDSAVESTPAGTEPAAPGARPSPTMVATAVARLWATGDGAISGMFIQDLEARWGCEFEAQVAAVPRELFADMLEARAELANRWAERFGLENVGVGLAPVTYALMTRLGSRTQVGGEPEGQLVDAEWIGSVAAIRCPDTVESVSLAAGPSDYPLSIDLGHL